MDYMDFNRNKTASVHKIQFYFLFFFSSNERMRPEFTGHALRSSKKHLRLSSPTSWMEKKST